MFWFIIGIVVTIGLFIFLGLNIDGRGRSSWKWSAKQLLAIFGLLLCLFGCIAKVPANHVGIVYSPFGGTKDTTLSEGFNTKSPFDTVYKISTEVQTVQIENLTTQTKDAQYVTTILDIKYRVNASNAFLIFKQYRTLENMSGNLIMPTTQRSLELVTTNYNVIDILGEKRSDIYAELDAALATEFAKYGVEFISISIIDMDAGAELEAAIMAEAVAKKEVETAEQNLLKAEMEAKQQSVQAQAEQDAARIEAETRLIEAEAEKKANEMLSQSLTPNILQMQWIEKWDGKMPAYYGGDGMGLIFNGVGMS
jgi:regulator of protease activity HflC (stomatin/prohibitin superfamily)